MSIQAAQLRNDILNYLTLQPYDGMFVESLLNLVQSLSIRPSPFLKQAILLLHQRAQQIPNEPFYNL
jgi:hypothetical protein